MFDILRDYLPEIDFDKVKLLLTYNQEVPLLFNTGLFLFLFLFFTFIYVTLKQQKTLRILFVVLFSYFFYYKTSGIFIILLFYVTLVDFLLGQFISKANNKREKKSLVILSLVNNLGLLCYFKYTDFLYQIYCDIVHQPFDSLGVFLPIGISFYIFQSISYTIDVYRGNLKPVTNFLDYAFYVSFFPLLVAGPIVRAKDFLPQITKPLLVTKDMFGRGICLIISGLFKKAVISDYISINFVDRIFDNPSLYSGVENMMGLYGYALQIYCDFSGYSDMAIGFAILLGFNINLNFDSPYKSATITEFWRRWHISLSSWLKDYLYITLGGNRKGKFRTYLNLFITMLLGGLWHGASLRFIIWGGLHGLSLAIHKLILTFFPNTKSEGYKMKTINRIFGVLLTFHIVCFGWLFFRIDSMGQAIDFMNQLVYSFHIELLPDLISGYPIVFGLMLLGFILHFLPRSMENNFINLIIKAPFGIKVIAVVTIIFIVIQIKSSEIQPFIYFQF